jgi:hypothetical protein
LERGRARVQVQGAGRTEKASDWERQGVDFESSRFVASEQIFKHGGRADGQEMSRDRKSGRDGIIKRKGCRLKQRWRNKQGQLVGILTINQGWDGRRDDGGGAARGFGVTGILR